MTNQQNPRDKQAPHTGKVDNDTNKLGEQAPTQLNQGQRTPNSRSHSECDWLLPPKCDSRSLRLLGVRCPWFHCMCACSPSLLVSLSTLTV